MEFAIIRLFVLGVLYSTNGLMNAMTGVVRGHGYSILPTALTLTGVCGFRLLWIYTVFARHHDPYILYSCYPLSWIITIIAQFTVYFSLRKRAYRANEARYAREHPV